MQKKILLVDDESSLRRTMNLGLSQAGYETEPCENGIKALKKLETYVKNNIPLEGIVVDVHLPDINGLKLVKIMKHKYPGIPIVMITGFADRYNMEEIHNLDATVLLEKPFTPDQLVEKLVQIIKEKAAAEAKDADEKAEAANEASAYILMNVNMDIFFDIYKKLHVLEPVIYCDATKGDYDIVLLVQTENRKKIRGIIEKDIKTIEGVKEVEILDVENPVLDESTNSILKDAEHVLDYFSAVSKEKDGKVCAYLLMEVEKEKQQDIYLNLKLNEDVVFCDYTSGRFNLATMVKADAFSEIDRLIKTKVNTLDGVVKVKKYSVVNMFEM